MKKLISATIALALLMTLITGCARQPGSEYTRYTNSFFDTFNTLVQVVGYTKTEEEFNSYYTQVHERFQELHKLYDIYNNYEGLNNIKTINDNAGIMPIEVDQELLDIIVLAKDWALSSEGLTNIALGPVLKIWHDYRTDGIDDPENAKLPPMDRLEAALLLTDINKVIINLENSTVFLSEEGMRLDIGAIAKGYATELAAREIEAAGLTSGAINAGGNVRTIGKPLDGVREYWGVGISDPDASLFGENRHLDLVYVHQASVVSSGDYQRYYYVDGVAYHHLINPRTLMPARYYRAITVVTKDSGYADLVSTELFLLPYEESRLLADSLKDVEAYWVLANGEVRYTEGMKTILRSHGAKNTK